MVHEVDLLPLNPHPYDPVLVQFLVGHPTASRITVHACGDAHLVRVPAFPAVSENVSIAGGSGTDAAQPGTLMVPTGAVFELVSSICSSTALPSWAEMVGQTRD